VAKGAVVKNFADLPLETRRSVYLRFDRRTGQPYVLIGKEKHYMDYFTAGLIATEAVRILHAMACREER